MKNVIAAFAALALSVPALADEIRLKNGSVLEGVARDQGDSVVIELDAGTVTIPKDQIRSVTHSSGPLDELEERVSLAKDAGIRSVVFDRGGYLYHGRVKALAEGAREGGLKF